MVLAPLTGPHLEVSVPGPPVPQGRARVGPHGHVLDPASRAWRQVAVPLMRLLRGHRGALEGRLRSVVIVVLPRPKRRPECATQEEWASGARVPAIGRGDLDNYIKAAWDAARDAGWLDNDSAVFEVTARKVYAATSEGPGLYLRLEPVEVWT